MILSLVFISQALSATAANDASAAAKSVMAIFVPGSKLAKHGKFEVKKCDNQSMRWIGLALLKQGFDAEYKFGEKCDAQGAFSPKMDEVFPVSFQIRNLNKYQTVKFNLLITSETQGAGIKYHLRANTGELIAPDEVVKFHGDYSIGLDFNRQQVLDKNGSGTITVDSINGKPINLTSKIQID